MRKLKGQRHLVLLAGFLVWATPVWISQAAEEEVSTTTTTTGTASDAATTTAGSTSATTDSSTATTPVAPANQPSGAGQFSQPPVQVLVTLVGGYDDNVNTATTTNGQASGFTTGTLDLDYRFGSPRLQLSLDGTAGATYYYQHIAAQNYDIDLHTNLSVKYKSTPRLTLGANLLISYLTEPSFNYGVGTNYRNGNYFYTADSFEATYQWSERFSTLTRYTVDLINYDNSAVGVFDDRVENVFGNEFRFLLVPTTTLVAEYRYEIVTYTHAPLDSGTQYVLAGFDHTFNPKLTATVRGGAEFRSYNNNNGGDRSSPYVESNVSYSVGKRTSVTWTTRYGLEEPDIAFAQSRTTFRTGLQAQIKLAPRVAATGDVFYDHSDYHSLSVGGGTQQAFTQDAVDAGLGLRYTVTPYVGISVGYNYTNVSSDVSVFGYSRNHYFAGINVVF